jgi:hypothetical protein
LCLQHIESGGLAKRRRDPAPAISVSVRPKPEDVPVINQVLFGCAPLTFSIAAA